MSTEKMEPVAWTRDFWGPDCGPYYEMHKSIDMTWRDKAEWTPLYTASQLQAAIAAERERCAKVCESLPSFHQEAPAVFKQCAEAIRQLGDEQ